MRRVIRTGWLYVIGLLIALFSTALAQRKTMPPASAETVDWALFLPAGEGQFQTSITCTACHSLEPIVRQKRTDESGWIGTVQAMAALPKANIQEDDAAAISKYLARFFTPVTPKLELPIHINTAGAQTLVLVTALSESDVQKILVARAKGPISDMAALEKIIGSDKLHKYKTYMAFDNTVERQQ